MIHRHGRPPTPGSAGTANLGIGTPDHRLDDVLRRLRCGRRAGSWVSVPSILRRGQTGRGRQTRKRPMPMLPSDRDFGPAGSRPNIIFKVLPTGNPDRQDRHGALVPGLRACPAHLPTCPHASIFLAPFPGSEGYSHLESGRSVLSDFTAGTDVHGSRRR